MAPSIHEAYDDLPPAAKAVPPPRVVMSPGGGSAYAMGQIYLDPEQRTGVWLANHFYHEYAHHLAAKTGITKSHEFAEAIKASAQRGSGIDADKLQPDVSSASKAVSHENASDFLRALEGKQWGSEEDYMRRGDNHYQEVFATAFQNYVHYNPRLWKQFPEMAAFMESLFGDDSPPLTELPSSKPKPG